MQQSSKYGWAYSIGFLYSYVLTVPHSVAVNLAFPDKIPVNGAPQGLSTLGVSQHVCFPAMVGTCMWTAMSTPDC